MDDNPKQYVDVGNLKKRITHVITANETLTSRHHNGVVLVQRPANSLAASVDITLAVPATPGFKCTIVNGGAYDNSVNLTVNPQAGDTMYAFGEAVRGTSGAPPNGRGIVNKSTGEGAVEVDVLNANEVGCCTYGVWTRAGA